MQPHDGSLEAPKGRLKLPQGKSTNHFAATPRFFTLVSVSYAIACNAE
jgi:hypothetical protein